MRHSAKYFLMAALAVTPVMGTAQGEAMDAAGQSTLDNNQQKVSYALGMEIATSLENLPEGIDSELVIKGLRDAMSGAEPMLSQQEATAAKQQFFQKMQQQRQQQQGQASEKNIQQGQAFLQKNKAKEDVEVTDSGLQYKVIEKGDGESPAAQDMVKVHYTGWTLDGEKFDSSYDRGQPAQFQLNQVIPGWTEGVQMMSEGAKYRFWIPSDLAYGERGSPPKIGPNETLKFEVELQEVTEAQQQQQPGGMSKEEMQKKLREKMRKQQRQQQQN